MELHPKMTNRYTTRTIHSDQSSKSSSQDPTSDLRPEVLTVQTHGSRQLARPERTSGQALAAFPPLTSCSAPRPLFSGRDVAGVVSGLKGISDEQAAQNTDKKLRVKFRDAYSRGDWLVSC